MARRMTPMPEEFSLVNVKHHEGSTVFSFEGESNLPWEVLQETIKDLIDRIQQEIDRQDGIVGHIKAFAEDEGGSAAFTATGYEIHTKLAKPRCTKINFAAIVFVSEEDAILKMMEDTLSQL